MTRCDNEGATHHTGCECHEARRDAEIERLKAEVKRLRDLIDTVIRNCMECYDKRECQSCAWLRKGTEKKR